MGNKILGVKKGLRISGLFLPLIGFLVSTNVAFAATPTIADADIEDTNGDGTMDQITVTFSENVDIIDGVAGDGFSGFNLSECTIPDADYEAFGVPSIVFSGLTGCTAYDTSITPTITYTHAVDCSTAGDICDSATSTPMADAESEVADDLADAVILGLSSTVANGKYGPGSSIDVNVTFSENVTIPGDLALNLDNGVTIHKTAGLSSSFSYDYTVGTTGSGEDYVDLKVASFTGTVFDVVGNNTDHPGIPAGNNLDDNNDIDIDTTAPNVTNTNLTIDDSGCGAVCVPGDTIYFNWDNTALGDNNSDVADVVFDVSNFDGSANQSTVNVGETYVYEYLIASGNVDGDFTFDLLSATDDVGNISGSVTSVDTAAIDNEEPTLDAGNLYYDTSACNGLSGECISGDDLTFLWNNSGIGDNNSDVTLLSQVSFDLSNFGEGVVTPDDNTGDVYSYTITLADGFYGNLNFSASVSDDAGNLTGPVDSTNFIFVDTQVPVMTGPNLSIDSSLCSGNFGICKVGDTITFRWNADGDGNTDVTNTNNVYFDLSNFGGAGAENPDTYSGGIFEKTFVVPAGSNDTGLGSVPFFAEAYDDSGNYVGTVQSADEILIDNESPNVSNGCISASGNNGIGGAFKFGDVPVFYWDNSLCDSVSDVGTVNFDASEFLSTETSISASDDGFGNYSATLPGLPDSQDDVSNVSVTVVDDVGNTTTVWGINDFEVDTITPEFEASNAIIARMNDGSPSTLDTNRWYYYDPDVSPNDFLRFMVTNVAEDDGNQLNEVKVCIRSLNEDAPDQTCTGSDFDDPLLYTNATIAPGNTTSNVLFNLNSLTSWPTTVDGFAMNVRLIDDVGNVTDSAASDEMFYAILNVDPKAMDSAIDNATTTDWFDIDDFTDVPAGFLVFNAQDGLGNDIARMTFNEALNLTDDATIQGLSNFAANVTTSNDVIRLDSSALAAFNVDTELMVVMDSGDQPGFVVKDNDGDIVGNIPNDAGVGPYDVDGLSGSHEASNFVWDDLNKTLTFDVTGFSEYDSDNVAPTATNSPLTGATGVATTTNIVTTFSEAMDTSNFAYTLSPNPGGLSVVWSAGNTVATISHTAFANSTAYTYTITTATDLAGNDLASGNTSSFTTVASSGGGGGGGGGGSSFIIGATSNSGTSTPTAISSTVTGTRTLERSIDLNDSMLEEVDVDGESMIQANVTGESGQITLGNDDMTLYIGPNTTVMADANWNGVIAPPSIVSLEKVLSGDKLNVVDGQDVPAEKIDFVLKIGSDNSKLQFSPAVKVEIPVDLPNGTVVQIFVSNDGSEFETLQTVTVVDGKLVFETSHLSYFAFATEMNMEIFPDLEGHWAKEFVMSLYNDGVVNGKADGNFEPDKYITRAELTKIALLGYEYSVSAVNGMPFSDVATDSWYAGFVATAKENSIVSGFAGNLFKPNTNITRAEALKILAKAGGLDPTLTGGVSEFSDVPSDAWYYDDVRMAVGMGVVNGYGDGTFRPNANITRAEASKILVKFLEMQ